MTSKSPQIEVTVIGEAAVVRFNRDKWLLLFMEPKQEVREELFALVDSDHLSLIVIDFENNDNVWLSCAFEAILVSLHRRLCKANGTLKLCNVPEAVMTQFQMNRLIELFNIYLDLQAALESGT